MVFKFRKFKAKLNWKAKEKPNEVVCLKYRIFSEFEAAGMCNIRYNFFVRHYFVAPPTPVIHRETPETQKPKAIIKIQQSLVKPMQANDLEEQKKSTHIYMMEDHEEVSNNKIVLRQTDNGKSVNWRETVEYLSDNDSRYLTKKLNVESNYISNGTHGSSSSYSSQAASIFFVGEEAEPTPGIRNVNFNENTEEHSSA